MPSSRAMGGNRVPAVEVLVNFCFVSMILISYRQLAIPACNHQTHFLPENSRVLPGYPCNGSIFRTLLYIFQNWASVTWDLFHMKFEDSWITWALLALLLRLAGSLVLPPQLYREVVAPAVVYFMRCVLLIFHTYQGPNFRPSPMGLRSMYKTFEAFDLGFFFSLLGVRRINPFFELAFCCGQAVSLLVLAGWYNRQQPGTVNMPLLILARVLSPVVTLYAERAARRRGYHYAAGAAVAGGAGEGDLRGGGTSSGDGGSGSGGEGALRLKGRKASDTEEKAAAPGPAGAGAGADASYGVGGDIARSAASLGRRAVRRLRGLGPAGGSISSGAEVSGAGKKAAAEDLPTGLVPDAPKRLGASCATERTPPDRAQDSETALKLPGTEARRHAKSEADPADPTDSGSATSAAAARVAGAPGEAPPGVTETMAVTAALVGHAEALPAGGEVAQRATLPRYRGFLRRETIYVKIPWAEPEDLQPDFRERLRELVEGRQRGPAPGGGPAPAPEAPSRRLGHVYVRRGCVELMLVLEWLEGPYPADLPTAPDVDSLLVALGLQPPPRQVPDGRPGRAEDPPGEPSSPARRSPTAAADLGAGSIAPGAGLDATGQGALPGSSHGVEMWTLEDAGSGGEPMQPHSHPAGTPRRPGPRVISARPRLLLLQLPPLPAEAPEDSNVDGVLAVLERPHADRSSGTGRERRGAEPQSPAPPAAVLRVEVVWGNEDGPPAALGPSMPAAAAAAATVVVVRSCGMLLAARIASCMASRGAGQQEEGQQEEGQQERRGTRGSGQTYGTPVASSYVYDIELLQLPPSPGVVLVELVWLSHAAPVSTGSPSYPPPARRVPRVLVPLLATHDPGVAGELEQAVASALPGRGGEMDGLLYDMGTWLGAAAAAVHASPYLRPLGCHLLCFARESGWGRTEEVLRQGGATCEETEEEEEEGQRDDGRKTGPIPSPLEEREDGMGAVRAAGPTAAAAAAASTQSNDGGGGTGASTAGSNHFSSSDPSGDTRTSTSTSTRGGLASCGTLSCTITSSTARTSSAAGDDTAVAKACGPSGRGEEGPGVQPEGPTAPVTKGHCGATQRQRCNCRCGSCDCCSDRPSQSGACPADMQQLALSAAGALPLFETALLAALLYRGHQAGAPLLTTTTGAMFLALGPGAVCTLARLLLPHRTWARMAVAARLPRYCGLIASKGWAALNPIKSAPGISPHAIWVGRLLHEGVMLPGSCPLDFRTALLVSAVKLLGNTAMLVSCGVVQSRLGAVLQAASVEALALATTAACQAYLRRVRRRAGASSRRTAGG